MMLTRGLALGILIFSSFAMLLVPSASATVVCAPVSGMPHCVDSGLGCAGAYERTNFAGGYYWIHCWGHSIYGLCDGDGLIGWTPSNTYYFVQCTGRSTAFDGTGETICTGFTNSHYDPNAPNQWSYSCTGAAVPAP